MNIGKYQYSNSTAAFGALFLVVGAAYGIATHKPVLTIVLVSMVGSMMGIGLGMIIYEPKRIKE